MYQVRNGQRVVPTCPECGCRLDEKAWGSYFHFIGKYDGKVTRDAAGHVCKYYAHAMKLMDNQFFINNSTNTLHPEKDWELA